MWLDVLLSEPLAASVLRAALAEALGVQAADVLVTKSLEEVPFQASERFLVAAYGRPGRYPMLLSIFAASDDRPSDGDTPKVLGKLAEITGATCLVSLDGMPEHEMLEIRSQDAMRIVDADDADEPARGRRRKGSNTAEGAVMDRFRLDSVAPVVAERFRQAPSNKRRQAAQVACEQAVVAADLTAPEVSEALAVLRGAAAPDASLRERLESMAARLDDEYFKLAEDVGRKQEALACFSKARATSALVFALTADDTQLHEAIYESISALGNPAEMVRLVERALG